MGSSKCFLYLGKKLYSLRKMITKYPKIVLLSRYCIMKLVIVAMQANMPSCWVRFSCWYSSSYSWPVVEFGKKMWNLMSQMTLSSMSLSWVTKSRKTGSLVPALRSYVSAIASLTIAYVFNAKIFNCSLNVVAFPNSVQKSLSPHSLARNVSSRIYFLISSVYKSNLTNIFSILLTGSNINYFVSSFDCSASSTGLLVSRIVKSSRLQWLMHLSATYDPTNTS